MNQVILSKIEQRRRQILVHSYIYYSLDQNIVSDEKWMKWAKELVELQKSYPDESKAAVYNVDFHDFDGSTGFYLNYCRPEIMAIGDWLVERRYAIW